MPDQPLESSLFTLELIPVVLDPLAPLGDLSPADHVLFTYPQIFFLLISLLNPCFDLADHLLDLRHGSLAIGNVTLRNLSLQIRDLLISLFSNFGFNFGFSSFDDGLQIATNSFAARNACEFFRTSLHIRGL